MEQNILSASKRSRKPEEVRAAGKVPAVVYGPEIEPISIELDYNTFDKLYNEAGMSTMIDLVVDGKEPIKVLIQDLQRDPIKHTVMHADFRQIKMGEEMTATTELVFEGVSPAVRELGGTLQESLREVNICCLPKDLVSHIVVDLSMLKTFDDMITIGDLKLPEGVVITDDPGTAIATVAAPLTDDQFKAMEESKVGDVTAVEVEAKKKEDEEAAAEEKKKESAA